MYLSNFTEKELYNSLREQFFIWKILNLISILVFEIKNFVCWLLAVVHPSFKHNANAMWKSESLFLPFPVCVLAKFHYSSDILIVDLLSYYLRFISFSNKLY